MDWKTLAVTQALVATDLHLAFDVLGDLAAQVTFDLDVLVDVGAEACDLSTLGAMKDILPNATVNCEDKPEHDPGIALWWNEDGTRRGGWFACCRDHDQEEAVERWRRVATAK